MGQNGGAQYVNSEFGRYFHFCQSFLSIRHVHGDVCKHLGKDSSTDREGMPVLLMFCKLPTFKCYYIDWGYIFYT